MQEILVPISDEHRTFTVEWGCSCGHVHTILGVPGETQEFTGLACEACGMVWNVPLVAPLIELWRELDHDRIEYE